jgi:hypothetical protein
MARQVRVEILADSRQLNRTLGQTEQRFKGFGSSIGRIGGAMAGAFAGVAVIGGIKGFVAAARESQAVARQTEAVIKSTGGAAKLSAQGFADLAASISKKVAVDDDVIQSGQNILATFTQVRNETGRGNDIFNQATVAAVDMAAAMNQGQVTAEGLKGANIQLGKALNDPLKGITALTRVGVTFTQGQKDQIKALVASGDRLGAQKIILAELTKEFGGSAAASATASKSLGVAWGNIQEQLGGALIPILDKVATWLSARLPGAVAFVQKAFGALSGAFREGDVTSRGLIGAFERVGVVARTLVFGVAALGAAFKGEGVTSDGFVGAMERVGVAARAVGIWFQTKVIPAIRTAMPFLREMATSVGGALVSAFRSVAPGLKTLWEGMQRLWPAVKVGLAIWGAYVFILYTKVIPTILRIAGPVLGFLFGALGKLLGWIGNVIRWIGLTIGWLLRFSVGTKTTADAIRVHGQRIGSVFAAVGTAGRFMWERALRPAFSAASAGFRTMSSVVQGAWDRVIRPVFVAMVTTWLRSVSSIINGAARAFGWIPKLGGPLRRAAGEFNQFADRVISELNRPKGRTITITARAVVTQGGVRVGFVQGRASGGPIFGPGTPTSDSIPILASRDEHMWSAAEVRKAGGHGAMERLRAMARAGALPRFATGGRVPRIPGRVGGSAFRVNHFIGRMDDARRALYARLHGLPPAPRGWSWAEDYTLVRNSFYGRGGARPARRRRTTALQRNAAILYRHLQRSSSLFEDLSWRGMPRGYNNDLLADAFYRSHRGFNFGSRGTRSTISRWLRAILPGFAAGGGVDVRYRGATNWGAFRGGLDSMSARATSLATSGARALAAKMAKEMATALGGGAGPGGWRWQMRVLRAAFPGLRLISGYFGRENAITATGRRSYHGMGRAVDVPPSMAVANWIRSHYGQRTRELIFSPMGNRQVHNGRNHYYTGITRRMHFDHVHWAYDKGGILPEDIYGVGRSGATYSMHRGETVTPRGAGTVTIEKGAVQINVYGSPGQSEQQIGEIAEARVHAALGSVLGSVRARRAR